MNWMLTDMDAYFASVEQTFRPELRGRPVGVIPVESEGTCVIAASYSAKEKGVKVGTGVREARRLCPGIVLVKARPSFYVEVHHQILRAVDRCIEVHKVYSIDEWTVRLRGDEQRPERAAELAREVKRRTLEEFGPYLTCSIGIAPTRLLAKIASGLEKPNGLTVLAVGELPDRLEHLALKKLCGISGGMLDRLERYGVRNVRQLWGLSRDQSVRVWGSVAGGQWWAGFHGIDEPEVPTRQHSMTHGNVLAPRFRNEEGARGITVRLVCKLGQRLRQEGYLARSLRLSVRDERGYCFAEDAGLPYVNDTSTLLQELFDLWRLRPPTSCPIKKVDVSVAGLVPASQVPRPLFAGAEKLQRLSRAIDAINSRWGPSSVYFAPAHHYRQHMENKIAFGRIPSDTE